MEQQCQDGSLFSTAKLRLNRTIATPGRAVKAGMISMTAPLVIGSRQRREAAALSPGPATLKSKASNVRRVRLGRSNTRNVRRGLFSAVSAGAGSPRRRDDQARLDQALHGLPPGKDILQVVQSWDTAVVGGPDNDWSVCTTWMYTRDCRWYLVEVWRARVDYPTLKAKVIEQANRWRAHRVLIEEAGAAIALVQELQYQVPGLIGVRPEREKIARMAVASAKLEAGQVHFPERASWLADLEAELFAFPGSRHDDQCDSISQALNDEGCNSLAIFMKAYG